MSTPTRCCSSALAMVMALASAPLTAAGEPPGCSVQVYEFHAGDGSRREVEETRSADGTIRSVEHRYDASNRLVGSGGYEISAAGAVRPIAQPAVAKVSPRGASRDSQRIELWLNAKFEEWNEVAERQVVAPSPTSKAAEGPADRMGD